MKQKTYKQLFITALLGLFISTSAQAELGTVDLKKVCDSYWKTKQADTTLKEQAAEFQKEVKAIDEEYKVAQKEYEKQAREANNQALSAAEREKQKKDAEAKLIKIRELEQLFAQINRQASTRISDDRNRVRMKILTEIQEVAQKKAKAAGYTMVIDIASESINQTPVIIYTDGSNDMTEELIEHLNLSAPTGFFEKLDMKGAK